MHTYVCTYVYTYVYTNVYTCVYTYVYTYETQKPQKKERKKLSPEARKQTRASESLKRNAKPSKETAHTIIPGGAKTNESFRKPQMKQKNLKRNRLGFLADRLRISGFDGRAD